LFSASRSQPIQSKPVIPKDEKKNKYGPSAINSWRAATGRAFGACSWEIYGDWTDDEAQLETRVVYLLGSG
jgi:hypothetical protein